MSEAPAPPPHGARWGDLAVSIPLGLWVFRVGEQYAKRHGKLKRAG